MNANRINLGIIRDSYGALRATSPAARAALDGAYRLAEQAVAAQKIPHAYDTMTRDRKGRWSGSARHHEAYDLSTSAVLLCLRTTVGSKYGVATTSKSYVIVRRCGRGVTVKDAPKAIAAKSAKGALALGEAIATCEGKKKLRVPALEKRAGYKLVERTETGHRSVWDKSEWTIGKTRIERATDDHSGGLYYYSTLEEALDAAYANETFYTARSHRQLAVLEVEVSGREIVFDGQKRCVSRIRPIRDVASTL